MQRAERERMTVVLLNTTPIVRKLVERLARKRGDTVYDGQTPDGRRAEMVIVDDSVRDRYDAAAAREYGGFVLFIGSRFDEMPEGFDAVLAKPFLPEALTRIFDEAQMALAADPGRSDLFDADEAADALEEAADETETLSRVFDEEEIDEVKQLLDAVEEETVEETETPSADDLEEQIAAALEEMDEREWERPVDEVLYDADVPEKTSAAEPEERFADIDLHARGVEALQDLMAILSDESVARALKEMGVRIDISFGEKT